MLSTFIQRQSNTVSYQAVVGGVPLIDGSGNPMLTQRAENYGYDALNRLTSVNYGDGQTQGHSFDGMGNRATKSDSSARSERLSNAV
jgi:YD repeat-containing protein